MNDDDLDRRMRAAAERLHREVAVASTPLPLPDGPARRRPGVAGRAVVAVAAALVLVAGVVAVGLARDGDGTEEVVSDDPTPDGDSRPLELAAPDDGRASQQLPVTVEPAVGLDVGQRVEVKGEGFEPGESVGVVQCASEAGVPLALGIDACEIGTVTYADADADGRVTVVHQVRRSVTSAALGTVDCASAAQRCIVAAGALSDYDRSGGFALTLTDGLAPLDLPVFAATPAEGLRDGDVVRLTGPAPAGTVAFVQQCAFDPRVCAPGEPTLRGASLTAGPDGIDGEVMVHRYLPGPRAGTYVDCIVSPCVLTVTFGTADGGVAPGDEGVTATTFVSGSPGEGGGAGLPAPTPVTLAFDPADATPPPAPTMTATPTEVREGDTVAVLAAGLTPGTEAYAAVCNLADGMVQYCASPGTPTAVAPDGTVAVEVAVVDDGGGDCLLDPDPDRCGLENGQLVVAISPWGPISGDVRSPRFLPTPVALTLVD